MAQSSPEIRFRIDQEERAQFELIAREIGMDPNDMVKVFIRRAIAARGFPFDMRAPVDESIVGTRALAVHGVNAPYLTALAKHAASKAHQEHIEAGRLEPSNTTLTETPNS